MRIGIDTRDLKIAKTGARTYLEGTLAALQSAEPQCEVVPLQPASGEARGGAWNKILEHASFTWWKQVELPHLARREHCDVLFCTNYAAPILSPCPVVAVFYDAAFWANPEHYNPIWRLLLRFFVLPAARRAAAIVTLSEFSRAQIHQHAQIPLQKIRVIPPGPKNTLARKWTGTQVRETLTRYGLGSDESFILHVGVLEKRKNLPRLVEAFADFQNRATKSFRLVLVGQPGPKRNMDDSEAIHSAIERNDLVRRIFLTGHVPDLDLGAFYRAAACFAFPSLYEGFGIPLLEAFGTGTPVVASYATAIPEVAGDAAQYFDPTDVKEIADTILRVTADSDLRNLLVERGYQRAAQYSWGRVADELIALFRESCAASWGRDGAKT